MISKKNILHLFLILFTGLVSCSKKENRFRPAGEQVVEIRATPSFSKIFLENHVDLEIQQDSFTEVRVIFGKNLIDGIKTEVKNGELLISDKNGGYWLRGFKPRAKVIVSVPNLTYITHEGTGQITCANYLRTDTLDVFLKSSGDAEIKVWNNKFLSHMMGTANLTVTGKTDEHAAYTTGLGFLYAGDLDTRYTWVYSYATGDCFLKASDLLIAIIRHDGNVFYRGNPGIEKTISGKGNLLPF